MNHQSAELIDSDAALTRAVDRFSSTSTLAFDTEAASFHRYIDRVYLLQISSDVETVLVDPLAVTDLGAIGQLLEDQDIEVVFHDADYDLRTLDRDFGFRATGLFDTRVAAQMTDEEGVGLAALLEKHFGVRLNKKYQRADWSLRPLSAEMIAYAADDTRYLIPLRTVLASKLEALGRLEWAAEEFRRLELVRWTASDDEDNYLKVKGARMLNARQRAVLKAAHQWRELKAEELDRAPFRVLANTVLIDVARTSPTASGQLSGIKGYPRSTSARGWLPQILAVVDEALRLPDDQLPRVKRRQRQRRDADYDRRLDQLKELRNRRAKETGIDPGLLCPNGTLQVIASQAEEGPFSPGNVPELRKWQYELLGDAAIVAAAGLQLEP